MLIVQAVLLLLLHDALQETGGSLISVDAILCLFEQLKIQRTLLVPDSLASRSPRTQE